MDYSRKCRDCGIKINEGEFKTFGICDNCWEKIYPPKTEKPINSGYPLLADVLAEIDERVSKRYGFYGWKSAVEEVLSKYFS